MLPFKPIASVMCDDVRVETGNKFILIGVYNGAIIVPGFPAEIQVSWWLQVFPEKAGALEVDIRVVKDDSDTLVRALAGFQFASVDFSGMVVPKTPLHLQGTGHLKLQMRLKEDSDWTTMYEFDVREGAALRATEQVVTRRQAR